MKHKTALVGVSGFLLALTVGFGAGVQMDDGREVFQLGTEVNSSQSVSTAEFDGRSIDLMREQGSTSTFYIDYDRDGSADTSLETIADGEVRSTSKIKDIDGKIYLLRFSYQDDSNLEDDGWLRLDTAVPARNGRG